MEQISWIKWKVSNILKHKSTYTQHLAGKTPKQPSLHNPCNSWSQMLSPSVKRVLAGFRAHCRFWGHILAEVANSWEYHHPMAVVLLSVLLKKQSSYQHIQYWNLNIKVRNKKATQLCHQEDVSKWGQLCKAWGWKVLPGLWFLGNAEQQDEVLWKSES